MTRTQCSSIRGSLRPRFLCLNLVAMLVLAALAPQPALAAVINLCRATSLAALYSCRAEAQSDYWLALGKCDNLANPAERIVCRRQALTALREANSLCEERFNARQEVCSRLGRLPYAPVINPSNFVVRIDNPYFPLRPGTTMVYEGQTPDGLEHSEFIITHNTRMILDVTCIEVHDIVYVAGQLIEDTLDWFAHDKEGNVWYFGENAKQIANGLVVGVEGSWTAGVDGAQPGLVMKAHPAVGDFYRQEFLLGTAEDLAEVLSVTDSVTVPYGSFANCVKTKDITPLEPGAVENKFYAPKIGLVRTVDLPNGQPLDLMRIITN